MCPTSQVTAGFIGCPQWSDPSAADFQELTGIRSIGIPMDIPNFDYALGKMHALEPVLIEAGKGLVAQGATVLGITGAPFCWAGIPVGETTYDRNRRVADACGVPVVSCTSGMLDWLDDLGAKRVALAPTYYTTEWRDGFIDFIGRAGFTITQASTMADLGITIADDAKVDEFVEGGQTPGQRDQTLFVSPTPEMIEATIAGVLKPGPADAVVVSGSGNRTLRSHRRLCAFAGVPVVAADTGLFRSVCRAAGLPIPPELA